MKTSKYVGQLNVSQLCESGLKSKQFQSWKILA